MQPEMLMCSRPIRLAVSWLAKRRVSSCAIGIERAFASEQ